MPLLGDSDALWQFMDSRMVKCTFKAQAQDFLPAKALMEATRREVIKNIVLKDENLRLSPSETSEFIDRICHEGCKLFLSCVYCSMPMSCLRNLMNMGFTDSNIPRTVDDCPSTENKRLFKTGFLVNLKRFYAPVFNMNSYQILDDTSPMPIDLEEELGNLLGRGAFGEVWNINIHADHFSFSVSKGVESRFAIKVISHPGSIEREKKFILAMADFNHKHLVKCMASFMFGAKYHMIYELANGNLEEFMVKYPEPSRNLELDTDWLIEQFVGLAGALRVIHVQETNAPQPSNNLLAVEKTQKKGGFIHDIKPENILMYGICFRLSDFSCAKVADFIVSISGQGHSHVTLSKSGTPNYVPPESQTGRTSRPYDMWSLGCVYLEILTWFLQGYSALETFRDARQCSVKPGGIEDEAFYYTEELGKNMKWELRPAVVTKIAELREICPVKLNNLLGVVTTLLRINPAERPTANELPGTLTGLGTILWDLPRRDSGMSSPPLRPLPTPPSESDNSDSESTGYMSIDKPIVRIQNATE